MLALRRTADVRRVQNARRVIPVSRILLGLGSTKVRVNRGHFPQDSSIVDQSS